MASTTSASTMSFVDAMKNRRSVYALNATMPISGARVQELVTTTMLNVPSAFNSQTERVVLLLGTESANFWSKTAGETMKRAFESEGKIDQWEKTKPRLDGFAKAAGTILFFYDTPTIQKSKERNPAYGPLFDEWAEHSSGMHQYVLWTALEAESPGKIGANLQHYNYSAEVEAAAKKAYGLPTGNELRLRAQLVFGGVNEGGFPTEPKEKISTNETIKSFGNL